MYFWTYGLRKTWLDKCLKSPVSEDPSTSHVLNRPNHWWNLKSSSFTIFIGHCEGNSVAKSLSCWYEKYWDCFITHWVPKTSILFLKETIYCNIFRCNCLRNKKPFWTFFLHLRNLDSIWAFLKKMWPS